MEKQSDFMQTYFGVLAKGETYLKFAYLLLAFPLGLIYFVFLVVGFSLGLSLIIIWVGLLILALLFPAIWAGIAFERTQAIYLLKQDIPPMSKPVTENQSFLERMKTFFTNPVTWKGLLYLFLKFPLGILQFVIVVTGLSLVLGFLAAPFAYPWISIDFGMWMVDSFSEAIGVFVIGILLLPAIFHFFNLIADLNGKLAKIMLGQSTYQTASPVASKAKTSVVEGGSVPTARVETPFEDILEVDEPDLQNDNQDINLESTQK